MTSTPGRVSAVRRVRRSNAHKYRYLVLFTAPALLIYLVFSVYPLLGTIGISLQKTSEGVATFAGFDNYRYLFTQPEQSQRFWGALLNNTGYFLIHLVIQIPVALVMAALLTSAPVRRLGGLYRTLIFIPTTLSVVIVGFIWRMIISPLWGVVTFPLLDNVTTALPTLAGMSIWQHVGVPMIFLYSALLAVPGSLVEAARMDGASGWRVFWSVKFPLIVPQFGLISILTFILTFNSFDIMYALKGAAPGPDYSTDILATMFYRTFFGWLSSPGNPNLGAALATVIFGIILVVTASYFLVLQRRLTSYEL